MRSNPFLEESPDFEQIDREDVEGKLRRDLSAAIAAGSPQIILVLGEYGMGKTFLMQNITRDIHSGRFFDKVNTQSLAVYFRVTPPKLPSGHLAFVYSQVVEGIGKIWFTSTIQRLREASPAGEIGVRRALSSLDLEYREALCRFGGPLENLAWRFLRGDSLRTSEMGELGVHESLDSDEASLRAMLCLLRLLELTNCKALLLFIDELEYIFSVASGKKVVQVMNTFKDLYDRVSDEKRAGRPGAAIHFIFASTPSAYQDTVSALISKEAPALQAFWERVFREVNLRPFETKEAIALVKSRLKVRRIKSVPDDLFPFDEPLVSEIRKVAQGIPRRIVRICAYVLIDAAERGLTTVDRSGLRRVLEFYPWARESTPASPVSA